MPLKKTTCGGFDPPVYTKVILLYIGVFRTFLHMKELCKQTIFPDQMYLKFYHLMSKPDLKSL